jgi:hypothetical protein
VRQLNRIESKSPSRTLTLRSPELTNIHTARDSVGKTKDRRYQRDKSGARSRNMNLKTTINSKQSRLKHNEEETVCDDKLMEIIDKNARYESNDRGTQMRQRIVFPKFEFQPIMSVDHKEDPARNTLES